MKLTPAQTKALNAIKADAAAKGHNKDLVHGAPDTTHSTLLALRDRGLIEFVGIQHGYYETYGRFGRGNVRRHPYTTFSINLVVK